MLSRLRIKGFKNLLDTELVFGPFTCIAGANAIGKSNVFDVVMLLRDLADLTIIEAVTRVRDRSGRQKGDLRALFSKLPDERIRDIDIEADFVVPKVVKDDFDRIAKPSATHLRYRIVLRYLLPTPSSMERIELTHESLTYLQRSESKAKLGFPMSNAFWDSIMGGPRRSEYISTEDYQGQPIIKLRQDGSRGRALEVPALSSPRTVLGTINTDDKPTALAARREMQSWLFLQLEPSQLRKPDDFSDPTRIGPDGSHLPATLSRIGKFGEVAARLSDLLPEVTEVFVDIDEGRRLKTLYLKSKDGLAHSARALSDGTLRFLALAILGADTSEGGVICLEEPENGIHPSRIQAMLSLLQDIAVDSYLPADLDNPLRQVIINTHSPLVVSLLDKNDLVVALPYQHLGTTLTTFGALEGTWRSSPAGEYRCMTVPMGLLLSYLQGPSSPKEIERTRSSYTESVRTFAMKQGAFDFVSESGACES